MFDRNYLEQSQTQMLRSWILFQMLKGAGWTAVVVVGIGVFFLILKVIAMILPVNPNAALDLGHALVALV